MMERKQTNKVTELVNKIKKHPFFSILLVSLLIRLIYLFFNQSLWWDSHVYIGMGKYIFSNGQIGIWESFRPLVHPIILGAFWKLKFEPLIIGKILDIIFSMTSIYLTYLIGKKVFNKNVGLIAAGIFSVTPLFIMYTGLILTEPLAITLGLWGTYLFLTKKNKINWLFLSSVLLGLAFLTKFPQGIIFGTLWIILLFRKNNLITKIKEMLVFSAGFIIFTIPYLIFNHLKYGLFYEPFISGSWIVTTATWVYGAGTFFYLNEFFFINLIYLFSFVFIYYFIKNKKWINEQQTCLVLIPLLIIAYFLYVPRKEIRYLILALPFLSILASKIIQKIYTYLKQQQKPIIKPIAFIILCLVLLFIIIPESLYFEEKPSFEQELQEIINEYNIKGIIISSNPEFISVLDKRIITLDGMNFAPEVYRRQKDNYDLIYINDCDLICAPDDNVCDKGKKEFLNLVYEENTIEFQKIVKNCTYMIGIPK